MAKYQEAFKRANLQGISEEVLPEQSAVDDEQEEEETTLPASSLPNNAIIQPDRSKTIKYLLSIGNLLQGSGGLENQAYRPADLGCCEQKMLGRKEAGGDG
ncbi:MAG: hypothetical protein M1829_004152 [Trizodia sp. TS-e1964]|nr:MAG: hypothetical protein M1829_004152 [Trizodia sp. TS-e1964]